MPDLSSDDNAQGDINNVARCRVVLCQVVWTLTLVGLVLCSIDASAVSVEPGGDRVSRKSASESVIPAIVSAYDGSSGALREPQYIEIAGLVMDTDGTSVSGVQVCIVPTNRLLRISDGHVSVDDGCLVKVTDTQGQFTFPSHHEDFDIVAFDNHGFAYLKDCNVGEVQRVTLQPYGRISGAIPLKSHESKKQVASVSMNFPPDINSDLPRVVWTVNAERGADGSFLMLRVPGGIGFISKYVWTAEGDRNVNSATGVRVDPGSTTIVDVGGRGRPVIGRIFPMTNEFSESSWTYGIGRIRATDFRPNTAESRADMTQNQSLFYECLVGEDGTLRAEHVRSGRYVLHVSAVKRGSGQPYGGKTIGSLEYAFVVPPMPDGRSNTPLDLSPLELDLRIIRRAAEPVIPPAIMRNRNPDNRRTASSRYGGSEAAEYAVERALRWLKVNQGEDGAWSGGAVKGAMTALGVLTFLAHGETPASEEFGDAVERGIWFLVSDQEETGRFTSRDERDYTHPICAYALSEAFTLTGITEVGEAAERAIELIIKGQHGTGGWNYNLNSVNRDDTSYMAWCAQALKAASIAGINVPGTDSAMRLAINGFMKNANRGGGFGYVQPRAPYELTGAGVLCLQLLGAAGDPHVKRGLLLLETRTCIWDHFPGSYPLYYWYYETQARFHEGNISWKVWNHQFSPTLIANQDVEPGKYTWNGVAYDIGSWNSPSAVEAYGKVYSTTLCAMMLQVYYRYLPTFALPATENDAPLTASK
jgi:hypothetical protein